MLRYKFGSYVSEENPCLQNVDSLDKQPFMLMQQV